VSNLSINVEAPPSKATLDAIGQGLDTYNKQFATTAYEEFALAFKDGDDTVRGGIYANAWAGMLFIKWFWIDEALRGQGHGRKLLGVAEDEGRRRGCTAVYLDTFEFQARPFYEKHGYQLFGSLDYPAGFKRFFLQKAL
jgi:GNAT superfamily N-acetyltransferase